MTKVRKNLLAIAIALLMVFGVVFTGGTVAYAATGEIGIGAGNSATITLTSGGTDTANVGTVDAGQYMLYFNVTDPVFADEETWKYESIYIELNWVDGEETYYEYLTYNPQLKMYYTMLPGIESGSAITFSAYYDAENVYAGSITGEAYLDKLALGAFNDYGLGNVKLPASIELELEKGEHIISVAPYIYEELEDFNPTYTVKIGEETITLEKDPDLSYTYTSQFTVDGTVTAEITGENAGDYLVDVRVYNYKEPVALPATNVEMSYDEPYLFSYQATKTGYMQMHATATVEGNPVNVVFSLASKTTPTSIVSTGYNVFNYPLYMENGNVYYFEIYYVEIEPDPDDPEAVVPDSILADISVQDWAPSTLGVEDVDQIIYLPVSTEDSEYVANINALEGNYDVILTEFTEEFDFGTDSLTLNVVKGDATEVYTLNIDNYFTASVNMTDVTSIYLTDGNGVFGFIISLTPITGTIAAGTAQEITMPAGRDGRYDVTGLTSNVPYRVTLTGIPAESQIEVTDPNGVVIPEGESEGVFIVSDWLVDYFFLNIYNYSETDAKFTILVEEEKNVTALTKNVESEVVLAGGQTRIYSVELPIGDYALRILGDTNIRAYTADATIVDEYDDAQVGRLSVYGEETVKVYIFFANTNTEEVTARVLLTDLKGAIELGVETEITIDDKNVAYTMILAEGTYTIYLGSDEIQVSVGKETVIYFGNTFGEFEVTFVGSETTEIILFFTYNGDGETTFTVTVEQN